MAKLSVAVAISVVFYVVVISHRETTSLSSPLLLSSKSLQGAEEQQQIMYHDYVSDPRSHSFGCCMLFMDDNHFLVEWLAFHYFTLPLRHVTVLVDPKSRTSPQAIFDRWTKPPYNLVVENWNDTYPDAYAATPPKQVGTPHEHPENRKIIGRQLQFFQDCVLSYKVDKKWSSWVIFTDTDEVRYSQSRFSWNGCLRRPIRLSYSFSLPARLSFVFLLKFGFIPVYFD